MRSLADRSPYRLVALGFLAIVAILVALPAYLWLDASWRPLAVRVACAVAVAAACVRARRAAGHAIRAQAPSPFEARPLPPPAPVLDERFLRARDDLVFSRRSRRYFDAILWPRLLALAGGDLARPRTWQWSGRFRSPLRRFRSPLRRFRSPLGRRGPSSAALARLIADVEGRADSPVGRADSPVGRA
jgi:hypothetical protein